MTLNNWGPAVVVVLGYLIGIFYQTHYVDKRFEDLYHYLDAKFGALEQRLTALEKETK